MQLTENILFTCLMFQTFGWKYITFCVLGFLFIYFVADF